MKLTIREAEEKGFTIDHCCYPPFGYKGLRFAPTESVKVLTSTESNLLEACEEARKALNTYEPSAAEEHAQNARILLKQAIPRARSEH